MMHPVKKPEGRVQKDSCLETGEGGIVLNKELPKDSIANRTISSNATIQGLYLPLHGNPPQWGVFEFVCLFGAEVAIFIDTAGEEVLHQACLDALLLGNQCLDLFNRPIHR